MHFMLITVISDKPLYEVVEYLFIAAALYKSRYRTAKRTVFTVNYNLCCAFDSPTISIQIRKEIIGRVKLASSPH